MATFVIPISDLTASGASGEVRAFAIASEWLTMELENTGIRGGSAPGSMEVRVFQSGNEFVVEGQVRAAMVAECARCLEDVPVAVDTHVNVVFSPEASRPKNETELELGDDDADTEYYEGAELVLDNLVREHLLLEVPMKPLCSESCPGISLPANERALRAFDEAKMKDSRLAPLSKLKELLARSEE